MPTEKSAETWREQMLEDLRGLWRLVKKYEHVFHSDVKAISEYRPDEWYSAMKTVAERIKAMPDEEVLERCKVTKAVATLMRETMHMPPGGVYGADNFNLFLDGISWR